MNYFTLFTFSSAVEFFVSCEVSKIPIWFDKDQIISPIFLPLREDGRARTGSSDFSSSKLRSEGSKGGGEVEEKNAVVSMLYNVALPKECPDARLLFHNVQN